MQMHSGGEGTLIRCSRARFSQIKVEANEGQQMEKGEPFVNEEEHQEMDDCL
jgi:hypothetical protein